jgi:hypothetical protein
MGRSPQSPHHFRSSSPPPQRPSFLPPPLRWLLLQRRPFGGHLPRSRLLGGLLRRLFGGLFFCHLFCGLLCCGHIRNLFRCSGPCCRRRVACSRGVTGPPGTIARAVADEAGLSARAVGGGPPAVDLPWPRVLIRLYNGTSSSLRTTRTTFPFPLLGPDWGQCRPGSPRCLPQGFVHLGTSRPTGSVQCRRLPLKALPPAASTSRSDPCRVAGTTPEG